MYKIAPLRNVSPHASPWEGNCTPKPWDYRITTAIPVMDTYESLKICIDLLNLQTIKPFIIIIDTGSEEFNLNKILNLRCENIEVHSLRLNGVFHPSDFPAFAMDLAQAICRTEYLFATHADVFVKKKNLLEYFLEFCGPEKDGKYPVVGYEISPRKHNDWKGMISHTASMYHVPTLDEIGFGWNMRRLATLYGFKEYRPSSDRPTWPDTEILGNVILRKNKIPTKIIGRELNFERTNDDNIDHCRSMTSGFLYNPEYYDKCQKWYELAKKEALNRIEIWKN